VPLIPKTRTWIRQWACSTSLTTSQQTSDGSTPVNRPTLQPVRSSESSCNKTFPHYISEYITYLPIPHKMSNSSQTLYISACYNKLLHGKSSILFKIITRDDKFSGGTSPSCLIIKTVQLYIYTHDGRSESKERFAIQRYLLIIGKKQNTQVLSHTFTYFST
jgi:hypothetical protein